MVESEGFKVGYNVYGVVCSVKGVSCKVQGLGGGIQVVWKENIRQRNGWGLGIRGSGF